MRTLALRSALFFLATLVAAPVRLPAAPNPTDTNKPVDLVILVDVSTSMFVNDPANRTASTDPDGIRWDGIQFLIDTAGSDDRIALIIYRGDAALVTRYLDPSGFVTLGSSNTDQRRKLKEMVTGFQKFERDFARNGGKWETDEYPIPGEKPLQLHGYGTGSLLALGAVLREWNLKFRDEEKHQRWVMLFTDGMDEPADGPVGVTRERDVVNDRLIIWGANRFKYTTAVKKGWEQKLEKPEKVALAPLEDEVKRTAALFREKRIPVFTFGMYASTTSEYVKSVMRTTLAPLAQKSLEGLASDHRFARIQAAWTASDNLELLRQLQNLGWELRERWQVVPKPLIRGPYQFKTPDRELCYDLGALLYQEVPGQGARAPESGKTKADGAESPLESRSHHYVRFLPGKGEGVVETQFGGSGLAHAVIGMGLKAPAIRLVPPDRTYTPIDAIPLIVEFDPQGSAALSREMFSVEAKVWEPGKAGRSRTPAFRAIDYPQIPGGWAFYAELIPDQNRKPDSPETKGLEGDWLIDVEVKAYETSPLRGATRRLLRTRITVGPYPKVDSPVGGIDVSNLGDNAGRGFTKFTLKSPEGKPVISSKKGELASLSVELVPTDPDTWKGIKPPVLSRAVVRNGEAETTLDLTTGFDWTAVPKEGLKGKLRVRTPWSEATAECEVTIRKEPYPVKVSGDLTFDLIGEGDLEDKKTDTIQAALQTSLATGESIRLSGQRDKMTGSFTVVDTKDKKNEIKLKLVDYETPVLVQGGKDSDVKVQVRKDKGQAIKTGVYTGMMYFLPEKPGVTEPVAVKVRVLVNQPVLKVGALQVPRIQLALLAGGQTTLPLKIVLKRPDGGEDAVTAKQKTQFDPLQLSASNDPTALIPLGELEEIGEDRFNLKVAIPSSVRDGRYTTWIPFDVQAGEKTFPARWALEVQVHRFAVFLTDDRPIAGSPWPKPTDYRRLQPDAEGHPGYDAVLPVQLNTVFSPNEGVRWRAEVLDDPSSPKPTDWYKKRIDVLVPSAGGPSQSVLLGKAPTPPVSKASPQNVIVTANDLASLPPGIYRCKLRFHGRLDPKNGGVKSDEIPFDLPIEVLVRGRTMIAERVGDNAIQVTVTCSGCVPGNGQIRSPDMTGPTVPVTSELSLVPSDKPVKFSSVQLTPGSGLTRYVVDWPKKVAESGLPQGVEPRAEDAWQSEIRFWRKPRMLVDRNVTAPGEKVTVRIPVTLATFDILKHPVTARLVRSGGAADGTEIRFTEDRANRELIATFPMPADPSTGEYQIKMMEPLVITDKLGAATDPKNLLLDPVVVQVGLDVKKSDQPIGPLIFGGGLLSSDQVGEPSVARITNNTNRELRYKVEVLYPKNFPDSQTITAQDLNTLPLGAFDPGLHLNFKPTTSEGTIQPGATAEIGVSVELSGDALDAYLNDREHRTLSAKNGAVLLVKVEGQGPDGPFNWEMRHPLVVETQSWRSRGLWYGLVGGIIAFFLVYWGYRRWRSWAARKRRPELGSRDPTTPDSVKKTGPVESPSQKDDEPSVGSLFGDPPP